MSDGRLHRFDVDVPSGAIGPPGDGLKGLVSDWEFSLFRGFRRKQPLPL